MEKFYISLAEALSEGSIIIPNIIFAGMISYDSSLVYILPFVLLYSFEKAGVFLIQGFGKINNPYAVLEAGLDMAMAGALMCLISGDKMFLFDAGAILIGLGLANYRDFYINIKNRLRKKGNWNYGKALLRGYFILLFIMIFVSVYNMKIHGPEEIIFAALLLMFIIIRLEIGKIKKNDTLSSQKIFLKRERSWKYFIPAILILAITFFVRMLKQTANPHLLFFIALVFCLIIIASFFYSKTDVTNYSFQTIWFGAVRNYITIFSLIYFIAVNKIYMLGMTYFVYVVALIISMFAGKKIAAGHSPEEFNRICIYGTAIPLVLFFNGYTYLFGVLISSMFASMGKKINLNYFEKKESIPELERRIVHSKLYNFGAILEQAILLTVIVFVSKFMYNNGGIAIEAYISYSKSGNIENIFFYTAILCFFIITLTGMIISKKINAANNKANA